jgi:hypothetical protein
MDMVSSPLRTDGRQAARGIAGGGVHPELKHLVREASQALATLDADRLEELALSCQALNRDLTAGGAKQAGLAIQAREAQGEMAVLNRILDATQANRTVLNRLRELGRGRRDYGERGASGWFHGEAGDGDN